MPSPKTKMTERELNALRDAHDVWQDATAAIARLTHERVELLSKLDPDGTLRALEEKRAVSQAQQLHASKRMEKVLESVTKRIRAANKKVSLNVSSGQILVEE